MAETDLQAMWEEAERRFEAKSAKKLRRAGAPKSLDEVVRELQSAKVEDDSNGVKMRDIGLKVLTCIQLLGGIVAQGASMVFAPAGLCFNAVSFLIAIPGKVSRVYETLGELFDKILVSFSQFKIYQRMEQYNNIDMVLKMTIHKLLIKFVDICGLSLDILHGGTWGKLKVITKITFFDDDSGVGAELAKLQALVQEQRAEVDTLTLESVLKSEKKLAELHEVLKISDRKLDEIRTVSDEIKKDIEEGFGKLIASDKGRKIDELKQQQLAKIKEKLVVKEIFTDTHKTNLSESVPGTGSWLDSIPEYTNWEDRDAKVAPVLYLTGNKNSGKSFLTSAIVRKLQMRYGQGDSSTTRTGIAYYFFREDSEKTDERLQTVETALKWMSLQIAQDDVVYRKEIASLCDAKDSPDFGSLSCGDLWQKLGFGAFKTNVTYFLLFDGIDLLAEESARQFLDILSRLQNTVSTSSQLRLRVMVTGHAKTFGPVSAPSIDVGKHNRVDIVKFIDQRLEKMYNLQADSAEKESLRNLIRTNLPERAQGDFFKVRYSLNAISKERWADGITRILDDAGEDRDTMLRREIAKSNEKLSTEDIEDLNELLAWVAFGQWWLTIEQMETALFLRHDKTSLQPLSDRLNKEYSKFFEVNEHRYLFIDTDMRDLVTKAKVEADSEGKMAKAEEHAPVKISESEIKMVKKFLQTFCEQEVFDKFGFEEFFARKARISATIGITEKDAHLIIAKRSLKLLTLEDEDRTKSLGLYALAKLPSHLENIVDPTKLSLSERTFIETELFKVVDDEDIIERRWQNDSELLETWVYETTAVETVWRWLKNSTIVKTLRKTPETWLSDTSPNAKTDFRLLGKVVRVMAKRWLRGREWEVQDAFPWVQSFVTKIQAPGDAASGVVNPHDPSYSQKPNDLNESDTPIDILAAASWAQAELEVKERDSLWHERLGLTYLQKEDYDQALDAFREAKTLDTSSWHADEGLALALAGKKDYPTAAKVIETVLETFRNNDDLRKQNAPRFMQNLKNLAIFRNELNQPNEAIKLYEEALRTDSQEYECVLGLLKILLSQNKTSDAQILLDRMKGQFIKRQDNESNVNQLVEMHQKFALDQSKGDDYYTTIFIIAQKGPGFESVYDTLQSAIDDARRMQNDTTESTDLLGALLFYHGSAVARKDDDKTKAIPIWTECHTLALTSGSIQLMQSGSEAVRQLSSYFFKQAIAAGYGSPEAEKYLQNLINLSMTSTENKNAWWAYSYMASTTIEMAKLLLGRYYGINGDLPRAKEYLQMYVQSGLDLLSDEDPENDWQGYLQLAEVLMHYGDELNALSAWSLLGPHDPKADSSLLQVETRVAEPSTNKEEDADTRTESAVPKKRQGDLGNVCDGACGTTWTFADDLYCCKYCPDIQFDQRCLDQLRAGTLNRHICGKDHEWLHVPKWSDAEFLEVGKGRVRIGGQMCDGKRVGGHAVDVEVWLDTLRNEWGIPKQDKKPQAEPL